MTINDVVRCLEGSRKILVRLWIPRGYLSCQDTEEIHYFPHFPVFPMKFGGKTTKYSKSVVHKSCRVCLEIKHISSFTKSAFNYCHSICNACSSRKGHKRQRINFAENSHLGLEPLHEILEKKNATQLIEDERSSFSVDSDTTSFKEELTHLSDESHLVDPVSKSTADDCETTSDLKTQVVAKIAPVTPN